MRLTVGPLPTAVYWRRRAAVLGALLVFLMIIVYSCSGSGGDDRKTGANGSPSPDASAPASPGVLTPETGAPPTEDDDVVDAPGSADPPTDTAPTQEQPAVGAVDGDACTDAEISVTPVPAQSAVRQGGTIELRLKVKNVSARTCSRDVGADLQEIYIKQGARTVWSSDRCGIAKGSRVEAFSPAFEREYQVSWNGRLSTACANGMATGNPAPAGDYQVFGRVGSKVSDPVRLQVVA
ncbi:hypothetical protein SAMN05444365_101713 [Micromonospora pattaloongensis]|uniref:Uncharacterized protein n=1 Tax=Micromonospora pattaloongensis TaxID=405436 RepID=A0A1H3H7L9_9ACTN|nr:hypothetical protein [Micromonospora pattaloongensis]SDY11407.1 hypothetical protein SAMN05444365_101713 [Micromonospora pattaloongensis]